MSKIKIKIQATEYNFNLIGINTSLKSYRVSYIINSVLGINLKKIDDFEKDIKNKKEKQSFEFFKDENNEIKYFLFENKTTGKELFRSYKGFDFVLLIKTEFEINFVQSIIKKLKDTKKFKIVLSINKLMKIDENFIEKNILYRNFDEEMKKKREINENSKQ